MRRVVLQSRIPDPPHGLVLAQPARQRERVFGVALRPERERLDALEQQKRVERAERRPEVAQPLDARPDGKGDVAELGFGVEHVRKAQPVVALGRLGEVGKAAVAPVEAPAVHDHAADGRAVPADPLRGRVRHDVGAVLQRAEKVAAGAERVVHHHRYAACVRDLGDGLEVGHAQARVADRLQKDGLGLAVDELAELLGVVGLGKARLDAEAFQLDFEQVVGPAVEVGRGDDVVAGLGERGEREQVRRLPARRRHRRRAAFERREALLEDVRRRVHDAGVDVAELLQAEELCRVVGAVEREGRGLVDRHGPAVGAGVGLLAGVELERVEVRRASGAVGAVLNAGHGIGRRWVRPGQEGFHARAHEKTPSGHGAGGGEQRGRYRTRELHAASGSVAGGHRATHHHLHATREGERDGGDQEAADGHERCGS